MRVISIDAHGGPSLPEDRVRSIVRRSLQNSPSYGPAQRDQRSGSAKGDTLIATFEYRELPDAVDHGRDLMVRMTVEEPKGLADRLGAEGLDITVLLEREAGEADLSTDLQLASDQLVTILQARTDLARAQDGAIERLLASEDPELIILTLEWVRDHESHDQALAVADRVVDLIKHEDERVGLLAIETIGQIGGPEHVSTLLDRIHLADTHQVNRAYDALARLGGPEALGFLRFAARNEDEPGRRAAAERALRRVAESDIVQPGGRGARLHNRGHR
ncbi:HEAT repeat domain-containing protein [Enhygromyxa salina]|uniref:HEAT repeat domain-containing protein n=1 Tax=Enhygromyxa salina TaxID=215803 RepID=UPI0015E5DA5B|nr:HEAT repeat domain-containing protein [Enhygromyxa salina]